MGENMTKGKKLTLVSLILMIFTSVFGFANMPRAFYLMGYSAIPWYILSAVLFFIPYAFMMAEYGSAFKKESGGIYSWMEKSVGAKYAFIGTFMWYASYIIWMVNVSSTIWVPLSNAIFGSDMTGELSFLGLSSTQCLGILGCLWILLVTFIASKGVEKIKKVTSVGGTAVALLNVVLLVGGFIVLASNRFQFNQPIVDVVKSFSVSPNPVYQTPLSILAFLTFAVFAFGGLEVLGGLVDQTENTEKTFPKGITIAAIVIAIGYAIGIFACGMFTNWNDILSSDNVNMANVAYVLMRNLGYELGMTFGMSQASSMTLGLWIARFVGLSMFLALTGAFFTLTYSPLKTLIEGSPKKLWPDKFVQTKDEMPVNAMWVQAVIAVIIILVISFGGSNGQAFFSILVLMTNVAMTIPYLFLAGAFPAFKKKQLAGEIEKPFVVYKSYGVALIASIIVSFLVGFANIFSIIEPAIDGRITDTVFMIAGPVLFSVIAFILYYLYEKKNDK